MRSSSLIELEVEVGVGVGVGVEVGVEVEVGVRGIEFGVGLTFLVVSYFFGWVGGWLGWGGVVGEVRYKANLNSSCS